MENYHVWEIKNAVSAFISPLLKEYISKVEANEIISVPDWIKKDGFDVCSMSTDEKNKEWAKILKKILYPFTYQMGEIDINFYSNKEQLMHHEKIKEGLNLFAKYFENLWD
jgi:hypothetical protein